MNPTLEIFSQGEEIVTGQVVDTNAAWLSEQAVELGFTVTRHTAVGDQLSVLIQILQEISQRADCCLCTGGLGPTVDDLTTAAVAEAFSLKLVFDETAFANIQSHFARRNRVMAECNRKQALLPEGAVRLDNDCGTAPGFALQGGRCWFAFMPGVPSEMKAMYLSYVKPDLAKRFILTPGSLIMIKTAGIGESDLQQRINGLNIPHGVQLGFRAIPGTVEVKLLFPYGYPADAQIILVQQVRTAIGDSVCD